MLLSMLPTATCITVTVFLLVHCIQGDSPSHTSSSITTTQSAKTTKQVTSTTEESSSVTATKKQTTSHWMSSTVGPSTQAVFNISTWNQLSSTFSSTQGPQWSKTEHAIIVCVVAVTVVAFLALFGTLLCRFGPSDRQKTKQKLKPRPSSRNTQKHLFRRAKGSPAVSRHIRPQSPMVTRTSSYAPDDGTKNVEAVDSTSRMYHRPSSVKVFLTPDDNKVIIPKMTLPSDMKAPSKLDPRFGTLNSKLCLVVDIEEPSQSDETSRSTCSGVELVTPQRELMPLKGPHSAKKPALGSTLAEENQKRSHHAVSGARTHRKVASAKRSRKHKQRRHSR